MPEQHLTATLSNAQLQDIKAALQTIQHHLPFCITLTSDQRRKLYKMGDKSKGFVNTSLTIAQSNPDILPPCFDLEGFVEDYQLATDLSELLLGLQQLTEQVSDTLMAVSSEAMSSGLAVYEYVKIAAKKTPGFKTIAQQLGKRFKAVRSKPSESTAPSPNADRVTSESENLVDESLPLAVESGNLVNESLPLVNESSPLVNESSPLVNESSPLVNESGNLVNESLPLAAESEHLADESSRLVHDDAELGQSKRRSPLGVQSLQGKREHLTIATANDGDRRSHDASQLGVLHGRSHPFLKAAKTNRHERSLLTNRLSDRAMEKEQATIWIN
jgi:hypothetical protein